MPTYQLTKPIQVGSKQITEFNYPDEILAEHLIDTSGAVNTTNDFIALIVNCCGEPVSVVRKMRARDMYALTKILGDKMGEQFFPATTKS